MVFYGALEMGHDVLHYLSDHYYLTLHRHHHDHHHNMHDHGHGHSDDHAHLSHSHEESPAQESVPAFINFFLFIQSAADFRFQNGAWEYVHEMATTHFLTRGVLPGTPPPKAIA